MTISIQFLLLSDGPSHKLLGINPSIGLRKLGINSEFWFQNRQTGKLIESPNYVFCLKPRDNDELALSYKQKNSKIVLILNDEQLPKHRTDIYDFVVSPSKTWKRLWEQNSRVPCYLIKEEFDYFTTKKHCDEELKIVTVGYSENLKRHLKFIEKITANFDFTIVSEKRIPEFRNASFRQFRPNYNFYFDKNYDKEVVEQFSDFNLGIVTQDESGRTSNRLKLLLYSGLPVICSRTENFEDLWFNETEMKLEFFSESVVDTIRLFSDYKKRQEITDFNYLKIRENAGLESSAKSFVEAIDLFEKGIN